MLLIDECTKYNLDFADVDRLARKLGIPTDHTHRIMAALCDVLRKHTNSGHTGLFYHASIYDGYNLIAKF